MNLLIDTHAVIWFITEDDQLPANVKELIEEATNTCFVSIASLWEMDIKYSSGKLEGLTLISKDGEFKDYNINLIWSE